MKVDLFDFELPRERIAQRPAKPRDSARLLTVGGNGGINDHGFGDLPGLLRPGDLMVFNDTRVIPARLKGKRGEAGVEVTLIREISAARWKAFARPGKKLKPGDAIIFADGFTATVTGKDGGEVELVFNLEGAALRDALAIHGAMPLPPYIKRAELADEQDAADYQTRFARCDGAVAAPTAGLHFTDAIMTALEERGIGHVLLTLHVGAGTFLPVKADDTSGHVMHSEWGEITGQAADIINATKEKGGRIVAVGSTSLRLMETAAGDDGLMHPFTGETDIFITPGYAFNITDLMLTNFHLPRSTLFMLVSAFAGLGTMRAAYAHAIGAGYRFYSYGDACLLERKPL